MELKTIKALTEEEKREFAKSEWQNEKMQDYLLKTYDFYKTQDNFIIEVVKASKLSITKELWYDDEYDAPQVNFENFFEHNEHNCNMFDCIITQLNEHKDAFFCNQYKNKASIICLFDADEMSKKRYGVTRKINATELADILAIYSEQKEQYKTRLEKYFKKYNNKIWARGYWANR